MPPTDALGTGANLPCLSIPSRPPGRLHRLGAFRVPPKGLTEEPPGRPGCRRPASVPQGSAADSDNLTFAAELGVSPPAALKILRQTQGSFPGPEGGRRPHDP